MHNGGWKLDADLAQFTHDGWRTDLRLSSGQPGFMHVANAASGTTLTDLHWLSFLWPDRSDLGPPNAYVRVDDVVSTWEELPQRPVRIEAYWRALTSASAAASTGGLPAFELMLSLQTSRLDQHPKVLAVSQWPAAQILTLHGRIRRAPEVEIDADSLIWFDADEPPTAADASPNLQDKRLQHGLQEIGAFVLRPVDSELSVVQIVHPIDHQPAAIRRTTPTHIRLEHPLFGQFLEKGVIIRARIRSALVPRSSDADSAVALLHDFITSQTPLTT